MIRAAVPGDLAAIAELQLASARAAFAHIGPVEQLEPRDWAADLAAAETALVAVADDGEVAGFAFVGGCELQFFFTHPRVWGHGHGRALLAAHPYETPEWLVVGAEHVGEKYLSWVEAKSHIPPL